MPEDKQNQWAKLMYYLFMFIYYRRGADEHEELISLVTESVHDGIRPLQKTHRKEVAEMGKTMAQVLIEKGERLGEKRGEIRGEKRGEKRGEIRGMLQAKQEDLLKLVQVRFGSVSQDVENKIKAISNANHLTALFDQGLIANNVNEVVNSL